MAYTGINKSSEHFNTKLYTGDGTSSNAITGVGFAPDFVWSKARNGANAHVLIDKVRGATKVLHSNATTGEQTSNANQDTISLDSDGFTVGTPTQFLGTNTNGRTVASWNWLANGAGSANTDGSISSTVSANTTSGFSVSTWNEISSSSAQTIGHGLGVAPDMMIMKRRNEGGSGWLVYHKSIGNTGAIFLEGNYSTSTSSSYWNNTSPTSSVFTLGAGWNASASYNWVSYNFAEKQGYSKFGSYTGNGSLDGTFIYTGFKPAWAMFKKTSAGADWFIMDNKRDPHNEMIRDLRPSRSDAENANTTYNDCDFISNGIKIREDNGDFNESGGSYIFMAFAEAPLVGTNNVPCTAR